MHLYKYVLKKYIHIYYTCIQHLQISLVSIILVKIYQERVTTYKIYSVSKWNILIGLNQPNIGLWISIKDAFWMLFNWIKLREYKSTLQNDVTQQMGVFNHPGDSTSNQKWGRFFSFTSR